MVLVVAPVFHIKPAEQFVAVNVTAVLAQTEAADVLSIGA